MGWEKSILCEILEATNLLTKLLQLCRRTQNKLLNNFDYRNDLQKYSWNAV